jgi:hypothetical protein
MLSQDTFLKTHAVCSNFTRAKEFEVIVSSVVIIAASEVVGHLEVLDSSNVHSMEVDTEKKDRDARELELRELDSELDVVNQNIQLADTLIGSLTAKLQKVNLRIRFL